MRDRQAISAPMQLLTAIEAADLLKVKPDRVRAWIKSGQIRGIDLSSNPGTGKPRFRVSESDLQAFLQTRAVTPDTRPKRRRRRNEDVIDFFPAQ